MKRILLLSTAIVGLGLSACGAKQNPTSTQNLPARCAEQACINNDVREFMVDGIRVIIKPVAHPPLVSANIYFDGGAALWTEDTSGHEQIALQVAVDGGPSSMTRDAYLSALEKVGAYVSASSDRDYARISLFSPAPVLEETLALVAQAVKSPAFEAQHFANTLSAQRSSVASRWDSADNAVREFAQALAWKNHPYAIHPQGTHESLESVDAGKIQEALTKLLVRERMTVVFVGQIDAAHAEKLVREHLSDIPSNSEWAQNANYPAVIAPFEYAQPTVEILERTQLPTNYILGYFAAPAPGHADYAPMVLATQILRHRLFEEVRTRRNLTYAVSSAIGSRRANIGLLYVTTTNPAATLPVMMETVDAMIADGGVTQQDIENNVRTWTTNFYMDLQSFSDQAHLLANWELVGGSRENADTILDELARVTPQDIARVLDLYVRNIQFAVVGSPDQAPSSLFTTR